MGTTDISRRSFLTAAGGAAVGAALGGGAVALAQADETPSTGAVPFDGAHQAGIVTPAQDRLHFAAFDIVAGATRDDLRDLLAAWTAAARRMADGLPAGPDKATPAAPPTDTGEADGLPPARLTVTLGLGPGVFDAGRFGLRRRAPKRLAALPPLPGDELDPERSGGDLCVQACADDPQVAFHAVRNLARIGRGIVVMRWSQLGFGRTSSTSSAQETPRNLMGFKDGTNNVTAEEPEALEQHIWARRDEPSWMAGGTYLVARRIRMLIEVWDRASLTDQEATIGRFKVSGAPLTGRREHDPPDFDAHDAAGPVIPAGAHMRLASPETNDGLRILRRCYSFTDGMDAELGQLDAGLFFVSFQNDPARFVTLQERLGTQDLLNEYIKHVGSAVFAIPGGTRSGEAIAESLFR